jgi:aryl-alcohol dehydrogenase-like predicted oxidoreductase
MTGHTDSFSYRSATTAPGSARRATKAGTQRYASRWQTPFVDDFYRTTGSGLKLSSLALGTYLGESDDETDALYSAALHRAFASGINVVDTAINYRCQRSERLIGRVLGDLVSQASLRREEVLICTKGGYVPLDGTPPVSREDYVRYLKETYFDCGLLSPGDLAAGGHTLRADFLVDQLHRSMQNLNVSCVDVFYIHNPEQQLSVVQPGELYKSLRSAFEALEECAERGEISFYGCATWNGLRLPAGSRGHLSLYDVAALAREVAGDTHRFRFVQLPINLGMSEAVRASTQRDPRGRLVHVFEAAAELGIDLVASASLMQGQLTRDLPAEIRSMFAGVTDAQRAIGFVRSVPSVVTAIIGMKSLEHVSENLAAVSRHPAGA